MQMGLLYRAVLTVGSPDLREFTGVICVVGLELWGMSIISGSKPSKGYSEPPHEGDSLVWAPRRQYRGHQRWLPG
jgi:hypothetical protein